MKVVKDDKALLNAQYFLAAFLSTIRSSALLRMPFERYKNSQHHHPLLVVGLVP
jgi:hypothetical protein